MSDVCTECLGTGFCGVCGGHGQFLCAPPSKMQDCLRCADHWPLPDLRTKTHARRVPGSFNAEPPSPIDPLKRGS